MAETLEDLHIHLLGRKTNGFPFVLQGNHFLGLVFPGRECFQFIILNRFNDFADDGLLIQIMLFGFFQRFKVLLMAAVDSGRSCFKPIPDFITQFFGYRTCIAELLMQLLKLVESGNNIFLVSQLFGSFAEMRFDFQVLFEVIFAEFIVQFQ